MRIAIVLVLLLSTLAIRLDGATYYIDYQSGTDANTGTSTWGPWKHCPGDPTATGNAAICSLLPGDRVIFKGGVTYDLTGGTGILLQWDGAPGQMITYDGNSEGGWGTGRALFTDHFGGNSITAFSSVDPRHHLSFRHLDIGQIGGAPWLPADPGYPIMPRFGGGIAFDGGAADVEIDNCVFHELGYWFSGRPMSAESLAGIAVSARGCDGLTITRCEFSRVAIACDLSQAVQIEALKITDCTFAEAIMWSIDLPPHLSGSVSLQRSHEFATHEFDLESWTGYGASPRTAEATISEGSTLTLKASAIASPAPNFQWHRNGTPIPGATASTLSLTRSTLADAGHYTATASNISGTARSNAVVVTVIPRLSGDTAPPWTPPADPAPPPLDLTPPWTPPPVDPAPPPLDPTPPWTPPLVDPTPPPLDPAPPPVNPTLPPLDPAPPPWTPPPVVDPAPPPSNPADSTTVPAVSVMPAHQFANSFTTATFTASVSGAPAPTLQWQKNGVPLAGATSATLSLPALTSNDAATYTVVATNAAGTATSNDAVLAVVEPSGWGPATNPDPFVATAYTTMLTVGWNPVSFSIEVRGTTPRWVLVRALGPSLVAFGINGALADPRLEIYSGQDLLAENDNWGGSSALRETFTAAGAFPLVDPWSADSAVAVLLAPGSYFGVVSGPSGMTGMVMVEVYELPVMNMGW